VNSNPSALTEASIRAALTAVYDPEFGISVEDLGLIYDVRLVAGHVTIAMTLTSQHCPAGAMMTDGVRAAVAALPQVTAVEVNLVWDPIWTPDFLSAKARDQLGIEPIGVGDSAGD
jgi:metal-sulfur cluster biosynthetic enzyme